VTPKLSLRSRVQSLRIPQALYSRRAQRHGGETGQVGGLEGLVFGVLIFVFGTLLVVNAWGVIDAKLAASSAAREAARSYVEAPTSEEASRRARLAAEEAMVGHGHETARTTVTLVAAGFSRCERVTFEVSHRVPLIVVPLIGRHGSGFTVAARHSEVVDPYRSGLTGAAVCRG
jgi:hypothetical protein